MTFMFNDSDYDLRSVIDGLRNGPDAQLLPPQSWVTMNFGSSYNQMVGAAGRGRESMPISFNDVWESMFNLAYATNANGSNQQYVARSLMFLVQYTSEAARLNDVYGIMATIMRSSDTHYSGLPLLQQELENSWDAMSSFARNLNNGTNPHPLYIPHVGTLRTFNDVRRYLVQGIGDGSQVSSTGDWRHTEL